MQRGWPGSNASLENRDHDEHLCPTRSGIATPRAGADGRHGREACGEGYARAQAGEQIGNKQAGGA